MNAFEITVRAQDGERVSYSGLLANSVDAVSYTLDCFPDARSIVVKAVAGGVA